MLLQLHPDYPLPPRHSPPCCLLSNLCCAGSAANTDLFLLDYVPAMTVQGFRRHPNTGQ
jgi:hypothetical protein